MTDNNIVKALQCLCGEEIPCKDCGYKTDGCPSCRKKVARDAIDLINRQQAQTDILTYTLWGVMHSVDKWLDGAELEQDEVNRAATMREKTLRIVEEKQAEIAEQKEYIDRCRSGKEYWVKCLIERPNEAVREFAEKLKESITDCHTVSDGEYVGYDWTDITHCIDNLVKEMVEA